MEAYVMMGLLYKLCETAERIFGVLCGLVGLMVIKELVHLYKAWHRK